MRILGRTVKGAELPTKILEFALTVARTFFYFKHPLIVLGHYIRSTRPTEGFVELRGGIKVFFSEHEHDLITTVVAFCRMDYGKVDRGASVLDIGANIGAFSLYAAHRGARRVVAFEPSTEAFACLVKNVQENGLEDVIAPVKLAVTGQSGEQVGIPTRSSPYNKIQPPAVSEQLELVDTISLDDILNRHSSGRVDVLKIDCEGAEYIIMPAAQDDTFAKISSIRMEYHKGPLPSLISHLEFRGFKVVKLKKQHEQSGIIWFAADD